MAKSKTIRVLVADDHHVVRSGIAASIGLEDDLSVVAEADSGEQVLAQYRASKPDVVLMDLRLPGMNGIEATATLIREAPEARVIMFTTYEGEEDIYRAVQAGARGYLLKSAPREELLDAIRRVAAGERYLPQALAHRLAERMASNDLSPREHEVLQLIGRGRSNKEIASDLGIAEDTVKRHVTNLMAKLRVADRTQATTEAIRRGLIHLH
jgi:two-component system NarL family response regulator